MWSRVRFPHPAPAKYQLDRYRSAFTSELGPPLSTECPRRPARAMGGRRSGHRLRRDSLPDQRRERCSERRYNRRIAKVDIARRIIALKYYGGACRCECRRGWWSVGRHPPGTRVAPPPSAGTVPGWAVRSPSAVCGMASSPASAESRRTAAEGARMTSFGLVRVASSTLRRPAASMNLTVERSRMRIDGLLASRCTSFDPVTMSSSPLTASRRGPLQQVRRSDVNRRRRVRQLM